ncbi:MAG TPA: hypothetical protein ENH62_11225 [Marinobacter sp.]|uniref:Phage protein n=1 Tax=marine sediment metagenome TaxID=412755 RepID=A0A0F9GFI5_9ZZZZ|nr:hypothetical protein [Marinobacter sp.]
MTSKQFETGWQHFLKCIDFNHSNLDAEAIAFMNEMPAEVRNALIASNIKKTFEDTRSKK